MSQEKNLTIRMPLAGEGDRKAFRWLAFLAAFRAWLFLAILLVVFEVWAQCSYHRTFLFTAFNIQSIAVFTVTPLLLGLGQTFVVISGGIDLSVGFTMGLSAVAFVPGLINGLLISKLRIPPFIGTLGMYGVARGAAYLLARGTTVPVANGPLNYIGNGVIGPLPIVVLVAFVIVVIMHYLLSGSRFGQHTYAIGGNVQAALRAGIDVPRNTLALYVLSAITAACAGILYTARFSAGAPQAGEPILLDSIAAVVIGGASLFGGSGTIVGTVIGSLIIAVIQYGLVFVNVEPFWQFIAVGVVIIISVLVDQLQKRTRK